MARNGDTRRGGDTGTHIITKTRPKTKRPSLYKVLLLNDDYTPMDFVVYVLERFFNKPLEEATRIMLHVHQKGVGICGVYTYEVAETKVAQGDELCPQHRAPYMHRGKESRIQVAAFSSPVWNQALRRALQYANARVTNMRRSSVCFCRC